ERELAELKKRDLLRVPEDSPVREGLQGQFGENFVDLSSNDYLGLRFVQTGPAFAASPTAMEPMDRDVSRETSDQAYCAPAAGGLRAGSERPKLAQTGREMAEPGLGELVDEPASSALERDSSDSRRGSSDNEATARDEQSAFAER